MDKIALSRVGASFTRCKKFELPTGNVLHGLKASDSDFQKFGEVYFSFVEYQAVKGWKRHNKMSMNLLVPVGKVKFVLSKDLCCSSPHFVEVVLSCANYGRLNIPQGVWVAFAGLEKAVNLVVNVADAEHDPQEVDLIEHDDVNYDWILQ